MSQAAAAAARGDPESSSCSLCLEGDDPDKQRTLGKGLGALFPVAQSSRTRTSAGPGTAGNILCWLCVINIATSDTRAVFVRQWLFIQHVPNTTRWGLIVCRVVSQTFLLLICTVKGEADLAVHTPILQVKKLRCSRVELLAQGCSAGRWWHLPLRISFLASETVPHAYLHSFEPLPNWHVSFFRLS